MKILVLCTLKKADIDAIKWEVVPALMKDYVVSLP